MKTFQNLLLYSLILSVYPKKTKTAGQLRGGAFTYNAQTKEYVPIQNAKGERTKYSKFMDKDSSALIVKYKKKPIPFIEPSAIYPLHKNTNKKATRNLHQEAILLPIERQFASLGIEQKAWRFL